MTRLPTTAEQVSFGSGGTVVVGVLYRPQNRAITPGVVLAHGFSGTMDWIVPDFAEAFARAGFAALTFDYRHLGVSGGEPRQLIDCARQREDIRNALTYMRSRADVDRIALWGTSLGGAHVLQVAAADHHLAAVVANVPAVDLLRGMRGRYVPPHMRMSPVRVAVATACLAGHAVVDAVRGAARATPHYIPVYGRPGHAVFADPALAGLFADLERGGAHLAQRGHPAVSVRRAAHRPQSAPAHHRAATGHPRPRRRGELQRLRP